MTVLIVGASVAGIRTAQALRTAGYDADIVVLGEESQAPYDKPQLSKQMLERDGGEPVPLLPVSQLEALNLDLRLGTRAVSLDPIRRVVTTDGGEFPYRKLVIATGSYARTLADGHQLAGVHTLRTYADSVALRGELGRVRQGDYATRRRDAGYALYANLDIDRADKPRRTAQLLENYRFFGAPLTAIITTDRTIGVYGAVDCGAYVATLLLAAQALGVASIPQAAIAMYSDHVRSFLALPDDRLVVCAVSFGYPDVDHPVNNFRTSRAQLDAVVRTV